MDEDGEKKSECADGSKKKASCAFCGAQSVKEKGYASFVEHNVKL